MRIYYISVWRNEKGSPPLELCHARYLNDFNFFTKGTVNKFLTFSGNTVSQRTAPGQRQSVKEGGDDGGEKWVHAYARSEGVCGIAVADHDYDKRIVHSLLSKVLDDFVTRYPRTAYVNLEPVPDSEKDRDGNSPQRCPLPELKDYIVKWQDPRQADNITKIQYELDETKILIHKTIEGVLERGEKIDNLVQKSDILNAQSKMFYTQAKKQNSCCVVM
ncbi:snare-like protein [Lojkania enalia]|uniref:Synaptobrevin homolog YKT6 n=1 Tax=Lojkania enalia TaxID=147567 RepID=A0A9P4N6X6_9PLEO|nr:snare-like protein [Didymosphaeria enalia]